MKKKLLSLCVAFGFLFMLFACEAKSNDDTQSIPNNLEPISAIGDCNVPTLDGGWVCIWADEFDGDQVDETKWTFEIDGQGGGNNELQYYRRENARVEDGKLIITAINESFMGRSYTSARLVTKYKGDFRYVRVIASAKMPSGRGTWPAIWMMPTMNVYGTWPNSGEIDIMEYVGYDVDRIHSTIHTRRFNHNIGTQIGRAITVENVEEQFYAYEMIWSPGKIVTYVDGVQIAQFGYNAALTSNTPYHHAFPFDQLFFIIINLAVGGNWGGVQGVDAQAFPTTFELEYVRVYKLDYATLDKESPTQPTNLSLALLQNTIFWRESTDDYGVEKYAVFIDGQFHKYANLNQVTFTGLTKGQDYQIQIQAVDFVGRTSPLSDSFTLSFT